MSYRLLASTCKDGDCPSIHSDDATGDVIVRSRAADDPSHELDVRFTPAEWSDLMQQLGH